MYVMFPRTLFTESACFFLLVVNLLFDLMINSRFKMLFCGTFFVCSLILHMLILRADVNIFGIDSKNCSIFRNAKVLLHLSEFGGRLPISPFK